MNAENIQKNKTFEDDSRHSTDKDELYNNFVGFDIGVPPIERLKMKQK